MTSPGNGAGAPRDVARNLLLASLDPQGRDLARFAGTDWSSIPWTWLLERAAAHKVMGLFVAQMKTHGFIDMLPPGVGERLDEAEQVVRTKADRARATFLEVTDAFRDADISYFLVKGSHLAETVYGDPYLRPFGDVDLVVTPDDMDRAERILKEREYFLYAPPFIRQKARRAWPGGAHPDSDLPESELRRLLYDHHRHLTFVVRREDPRIPVELHWQLANPGIIRTDPSGPWSETEARVICGVATTTLSLEAMFLHVVVHAMQQAPLAFKLLHLCDVAWILGRRGDELRPDHLRELAERWGVARHLLCALYAAEAVFPFGLRGDRLASRRSRWSRECVRLARLDPFIVDHERPRTRLGRLTSRLVREAFWDLAFLNPPRRAAESLRAVMLNSTESLRGSVTGVASGSRR